MSEKMDTITAEESSTFCERMEASKPWLETARLGQRIVKELGYEQGSNTLGRWMAHRVAELIVLAESSASAEVCSAAKRECTDLILRLWKSRSEWPTGGPVGRIVPVLRQICDPQAPSRPQKGWAGLLNVLTSLHLKERRLLGQAMLGDESKAIIAHHDSWTEEFLHDLSDEELEAFILARELLEELHSDHFFLDGRRVPNFTLLPVEERITYLRESMRTISEERHAACEAALTQRADKNEAAAKQEGSLFDIPPDEEKQAEYFSALFAGKLPLATKVASEVDEWDDDD